MQKTIITVVGQDTVGIIAKVCTYLANNQVNILDISQTIVQGYFNMMMITDTGNSSKPLGDIGRECIYAKFQIKERKRQIRCCEKGASDHERLP